MYILLNHALAFAQTHETLLLQASQGVLSAGQVYAMRVFFLALGGTTYLRAEFAVSLFAECKADGRASPAAG